jgi:hypothetical protein
MKHLGKTTVGWTAITLGLATAIASAWATTTPVGAGFTLGLGAMTVMYGVWSLIARDPTTDHWALSVVGLVLGISPWVGGYAGDGAAWVAWIAGLALLALGAAAYIADEAANVAETVRVKALATYQLQHPQSSRDPEWTTPEEERQPTVHDYPDSRADEVDDPRPGHGKDSARTRRRGKQKTRSLDAGAHRSSGVRALHRSESVGAYTVFSAFGWQRAPIRRLQYSVLARSRSRYQRPFWQRTFEDTLTQPRRHPRSSSSPIRQMLSAGAR